MLLKILYLLTWRVLGVAVLVIRSDRVRAAELLVLRHENAVLRRHWTEIFPVTPATLLAWHRKLAAAKYDTSKRRKPGRPPTVRGVARLLVLRLVRENPGYVEPGVMWSRAAESVTARPGVRQRFT